MVFLGAVIMLTIPNIKTIKIKIITITSGFIFNCFSYLAKKLGNLENIPENKNRPINTRNIPEIKGINLIKALNLVNTKRNWFIKIAAIKNGTPRPNEYANKSIDARGKLSSVDAYISMLDKIGPTHGVQPKANAMPTNIELIYPKLFFFKASVFSFAKNPILKKPIICRPNNTINIPPILSSHSLFIPKKLPMYDIVRPNNTNTIEKPKMKNKEFIIVDFLTSEAPPVFFMSSKDLPVI